MQPASNARTVRLVVNVVNAASAAKDVVAVVAVAIVVLVTRLLPAMQHKWTRLLPLPLQLAQCPTWAPNKRLPLTP